MRRSSRRLIESDGPRDKRARPARDVEETDLSAAGRSLATGGCHGTMRGQKLPSPVTSRPTLRSLFHIVKRRLRNKKKEKHRGRLSLLTTIETCRHSACPTELNSS